MIIILYIIHWFGGEGFIESVSRWKIEFIPVNFIMLKRNGIGTQYKPVIQKPAVDLRQ